MLTKPKIQIATWVITPQNDVGHLYVLGHPLCCAAVPLFPSLCEGSIEMTLACCPLSWISLDSLASMQQFKEPEQEDTSTNML